MKEIRVYVIEGKEYYSLSDEDFMDIAENNGRVYTLRGFKEAFNLEEVNSSIDTIRFIEVVLADESLFEEL